MLRARLLPSAMLVLLAACAAGPPPEPPAPEFDPAGLWSFSVDIEGQPLTGTMRIRGSEADGYRGSFSSEAGEARMSRVTFAGTTMSFTIPELGASGTLEFEGDRFTGEFDGDMGIIEVTGRRQGG